MLAILIFGALLPSAPATDPDAAGRSDAAATAAIAETDVVRAARHFLELGDQARWADAYAVTGSSFQQHNTLQLWSDTAKQVRGPLGKLVSRTAISADSVPTPPAGAEIVKFRASFANKADVVETVSLVREGSTWKVAGIYLN